MYSTILVAYDGTKHGKAALGQAVRLARLFGAHLHLLGIVQTSGLAAMTESLAAVDVWSLERNQVEAALDAASDDVKATDLRISTEVREGDPADEIIDVAFDLLPDLVIMGHSDKGAFARWFERSVGSKILRHLPCDLLVVHDR